MSLPPSLMTRLFTFLCQQDSMSLPLSLTPYISTAARISLSTGRKPTQCHYHRSRHGCSHFFVNRTEAHSMSLPPSFTPYIGTAARISLSTGRKPTQCHSQRPSRPMPVLLLAFHCRQDGSHFNVAPPSLMAESDTVARISLSTGPEPIQYRSHRPSCPMILIRLLAFQCRSTVPHAQHQSGCPHFCVNRTEGELMSLPPSFMHETLYSHSIGNNRHCKAAFALLKRRGTYENNVPVS